MSARDPFGTAAVRERVLAAWVASPARLREDANAEEDLSLGGYRDRVVVELAQNAADAAVAAGVPGRLRLTLLTPATGEGRVLAAANTGAPLDAAGVAALATLRASAKRSADPAAAVGRFGVGFAAVLALTDEPMLVSRSGAVRFSRADTAQRVAELGGPELADEVRRRDGHVPVLRLPFEAEGEPPSGFTTAVLLPLRDDAAADLARRLLDDVDDALLLALPGLAEVEIEVDGTQRVVRDVGSRWHTLTRSGTFTARERDRLYADRPSEESRRPWWSVLWALPQDGSSAVPEVLHAPTPTDEPMPWPALLVATFPLDPSRRHVAPGPLTDRLVAEAATAYAALLVERAATGADVLGLVPTGLPSGAVDGALRAAVVAELTGAPILRRVEDGTPLRPREAVTLAGMSGSDHAVLAALAPHVSGLVAAPVSGRSALRVLGVEALALADVVESLPRPADPAGWAGRYAALAPIAEDADGREALGVLPVPLADGRVVRGARGLLLPSGGLPPEVLSELAAAGVRLVATEAVHPVLARLGALPATARQLLEDPAVRELVETSPEHEDPLGVCDTVLAVVQAAVAAGELRPGDLPWLGDLAMVDSDDDLAPASALALPGSPAAALFDPDEIGLVEAGLVERWGADTLVAAGVLEGPGLVRADDVDLAAPDELLLDLDGFEDWAAAAQDAAGGGAVVGELLALRDLDAVRRDALDDLVRAVVAHPRTREALLTPVRVRDQRGRVASLPSYTAWWVRRELDLAGTLDPAGDPALAGLLDPAPGWVGALDLEVRRALGVVGSLVDLGGPGSTAPDPLIELVLARLADPARDVTLAGLLRLWRWLAERAERVEAADGAPPTHLRALDAGLVPVVVPAADVAVIEAPMWLQRKDIGPFVIAPAGRGDALADLLDAALPLERVAGKVTSSGTPTDVPDGVRRVLTSAPARWCRHERLEVDGAAVTWWVDDAGCPHAGSLAALAPALAWAAGEWSARAAVAAALVSPESVPLLLAEAAFD